MSRIYQEADFFLLPTEYEIFGMVLLEAMYYGNVVLTTENGGSSMLIENGENGIVLAQKNASVWADEIMRLHADPAKRTMISSKARQKVANGFTWDALVDRFGKIYESSRTRTVF